MNRKAGINGIEVEYLNRDDVLNAFQNIKNISEETKVISDYIKQLSPEVKLHFMNVPNKTILTIGDTKYSLHKEE